MLMMIGAGIALGGLVAGSFAGLGLALGICGIGALLLIVAGWQSEKREREAESWRAAYPSYKY